ncbi:hypothetical protein A2U01_0001218, partial [Trifolium medium]|nr:hypothetical protein [Trifolium medium]
FRHTTRPSSKSSANHNQLQHTTCVATLLQPAKKRMFSGNHNQLRAMPLPHNVPSVILCHRALPRPCVWGFGLRRKKGF